MKKLRYPRWLAIFVFVIAVVAVAPAAATAAEEAPESGSTETAPPSEGGTGWVPQGGGEDSGDEGGAQRGSSLGSGGGSGGGGSSNDQPAPSEPPPAPAPVTSDSSESQPSSPPSYDEPASTPRVEAAPSAPEPRPAKPAPVGKAGLGGADAVARPEKPQVEAVPVATTVPTPVADTSAAAPSSGGGMIWPAVIIGVLILLYAGARLLLGPVEPDIFRSSPLRRFRRGFPRASSR